MKLNSKYLMCMESTSLKLIMIELASPDCTVLHRYVSKLNTEKFFLRENYF